ncbi:unnamed protein product [Leuciscus chuanchicus]
MPTHPAQGRHASASTAAAAPTLAPFKVLTSTHADATVESFGFTLKRNVGITISSPQSQLPIYISQGSQQRMHVPFQLGVILLAVLSSRLQSKKTICCPGLKPDMLNGFLMYIGSVPVPVHCLIDSHSPCELCELNRLRQGKGSWGPRGQRSSWALCAVTLQRCVSEDLCSGRGHLSPHKVTGQLCVISTSSRRHYVYAVYKGKFELIGEQALDLQCFVFPARGPDGGKEARQGAAGGSVDLKGFNQKHTTDTHETQYHCARSQTYNTHTNTHKHAQTTGFVPFCRHTQTWFHIMMQLQGSKTFSFIHIYTLIFWPFTLKVPLRCVSMRYHIPDNHCTPLYQVPLHPLWVFLIATGFRLAATGCDKTAGGKVGWEVGGGGTAAVTGQTEAGGRWSILTTTRHHQKQCQRRQLASHRKSPATVI